MDPTENASGKITPNVRMFDGAFWLSILIIAAQIIAAIVAYPLLPPQVPSHWNAAGQVNGYMPRLLYVIFEPGISMFIFLLIRGLMKIGPSLGQANAKRANRAIVDITLVGILLLMLILQLTTTAIALGAHIDVTLIVSLAVSVLFIFIGNYLGKLRRNFWAGIRTLWTLASKSAPQNVLSHC